MSGNKISFVPDFIHQHSDNPSSNHRTCRSFVLRRVFCICRCRCWFHKWDCCFGFRPQRRRKVDIRRTKSRNNWANNDRIWSRPRLVYIWAKERKFDAGTILDRRCKDKEEGVGFQWGLDVATKCNNNLNTFYEEISSVHIF